VSKVAIFDRDGTIVDVVRDEETGFVGVAFHPRQLRLLKDAVAGMLRFQAAGFRIAIATNQPAPAKGQFSRAAVEATNRALVELLAQAGVAVEHIAVCMHHPDGGEGGDPSLVGPCACRKPKPGLVVDALAALGGDPQSSWMIGDSPGDVEAGRAAGVRTALVFDTKRCELCPLRAGPSGAQRTPDASGPTLLAIAKVVLGT
jgi:D-glycero-D-manno-heptose 1,7-bisphosphate phosphatase